MDAAALPDASAGFDSPADAIETDLSRIPGSGDGAPVDRTGGRCDRDPMLPRGTLVIALCLFEVGCGRIGYDAFGNGGDASADGGDAGLPGDASADGGARDAGLGMDASVDAGAGDAGVDAGTALHGFVIDTTFGAGGVVVIDNGGINNVGYSIQGIAVQPDGRIVVAGSGGTAANEDTLVARLLDDGSLDPSFGSGGIVLVDVLPAESAGSVVIQPDGRIVVGAGGTPSGGTPGGIVIRLDADGSRDSTFGNHGPGVSVVDFPGNPDAPNGAYVGSDGKIVFGGQSWSSTSPVGWDLATTRLNPDGSLDTTFGTSGFVMTDIFGGTSSGHRAQSCPTDGSTSRAAPMTPRRPSTASS